MRQADVVFNDYNELALKTLMRSRNRAEQWQKARRLSGGFGVWAAGGSAGIVRVVVSERHADDLGKPDEGDEVGKDHKAVEHVGQLPHEVHLQHGTKHDEAHDDEAIRRRALGAEQVLDVLLAEEIPADDGRGKRRRTGRLPQR